MKLKFLPIVLMSFSIGFTSYEEDDETVTKEVKSSFKGFYDNCRGKENCEKSR